MPEEITEKKIRARLSDGQTRFGDNSIRHLLSIIDGQRGLIAMHEANADEAALKAARREATIASLVSEPFQGAGNSVRRAVEITCDELLNDEDSTAFDCMGDACQRMKIELRNLRAQVLEARTQFSYPVNLFEILANNNLGDAIVSQESDIEPIKEIGQGNG